jgi:copper chaperone
MSTVTLAIKGMTCGHCVKAVKDALKDLPGVDNLEVQIGTATLSYDAAKLSVDQIKGAVTEEGYEVV